MPYVLSDPILGAVAASAGVAAEKTAATPRPASKLRQLRLKLKLALEAHGMSSCDCEVKAVLAFMECPLMCNEVVTL